MVNEKTLVFLKSINDKWFEQLEADTLTGEELKKCKADFKKLGEMINKEGGFDLMSEFILTFPQWERRFIDFCWHNVGEWRA